MIDGSRESANSRERQEEAKGRRIEIRRTFVHLLLDEQSRIGLEDLVDGSLSLDASILEGNEEVGSRSSHGDVVSLDEGCEKMSFVEGKGGGKKRGKKSHDEDDSSTFEDVSSKAVIDDEARGLDVEAV